MNDPEQQDRMYHDRVRERDALAVQLAQMWGWPAEPTAVLERLRGDRTAALTTFSEEAYLAYLGARQPVPKAPE